jgi:hypothetical protein
MILAQKIDYLFCETLSLPPVFVLLICFTLVVFPNVLLVL